MLLQMQNIICQYVDVDPREITENTVLIEDLGINSYDLVSLVCTIEEEFSVVIPDRDILEFVTLGDVIKYIEGKTN